MELLSVSWHNLIALQPKELAAGAFALAAAFEIMFPFDYDK